MSRTESFLAITCQYHACEENTKSRHGVIQASYFNEVYVVSNTHDHAFFFLTNRFHHVPLSINHAIKIHKCLIAFGYAEHASHVKPWLHEVGITDLATLLCLTIRKPSPLRSTMQRIPNDLLLIQLSVCRNRIGQKRHHSRVRPTDKKTQSCWDAHTMFYFSANTKDTSKKPPKRCVGLKLGINHSLQIQDAFMVWAAVLIRAIPCRSPIDSLPTPCQPLINPLIIPQSWQLIVFCFTKANEISNVQLWFTTPDLG